MTSEEDSKMYYLYRDGQPIHCDHRKLNLCELMLNIGAELEAKIDHQCRQVFVDCVLDRLVLSSMPRFEATRYERIEHVLEVRE